jgi:hypothetical protein
MISTWQRFFKIDVDTKAAMLFKRVSLVSITASPPSQGIQPRNPWVRNRVNRQEPSRLEKTGGNTAGRFFVREFAL